MICRRAKPPLSKERELRELKHIINGIREEMRYYLANSNDQEYGALN